jgi:hypothetical protein
MDGTGVPVVKKETVGRQGKTEGHPAHTREAKLGCVFTETSWDKEGYPIHDPDSTTYTSRTLRSIAETLAQAASRRRHHHRTTYPPHRLTCTRLLEREPVEIAYRVVVAAAIHNELQGVQTLRKFDGRNLECLPGLPSFGLRN